MMITEFILEEKTIKSGGVPFLSINVENKWHYQKIGLIHVK